MPAGKTSLELGAENQTRLVDRPVTGKLFTFSPVIDRFLKAHLFGDIFERDVLDFKTREIVTLSALASVNGLTPQLRGHLRASMNVGLSEAQIRDLISVIGSKVVKKQAETASGLLDQVLGKNKGKTSGSGNAKAKAAKVIVSPHKTLPARKGDAKHFTGEVDIDTLFNAPAPSNFRGGRVAFKPGARTAWHSHTKGQLLIITSGAGLVQGWGEPVQEVRKGDVVWFPPRVKHWHGAAPDSAMTHIAIVEPLNGKSTDWLELVSDEQYGK